jgi:hypothetical protein
MKLMKRWGVMTLVALLVLGTMGAALADEDVDVEETAKELPQQGIYGPDDGAPVLEWADGLVQFVFYWGYSDEDLESEAGPKCSAPAAGDSAGMFGLFGPAALTELDDCVLLNVEKNGHVNHGSMVSSFVHWLKGDNLEELLGELEGENPDLVQELRDMPKGQLVKMFAQNDFGKGNFVLPHLEETLEAADVEVDDSDGHGPPASVLEKKAEKAAAKADKGKNK